MAYAHPGQPKGWRSIEVKPTRTGLEAGERFERFRLEALTEMLLRVAGILMIFASILMWFLLPADPSTGRLASFGVMASVLAAGGLGVFAYGTRGFRRQIKLDTDTGKMTLTKVNMHEQARVSREIDLGYIESVFLRRPNTPGGMAQLLVRVSGNPVPAIALSGDMDEMERMHAQLCAVTQTAQTMWRRTGAAKVTSSVEGEQRPRAKPRLFAA